MELVFKSALSSSVLYGCESWLCNDITPAVPPILSAQKQLLSVRNQTCSDLIPAELGYSETKIMVKEAQMKFIEKLTSRDNYIGSPANFVLNLVTQAGTQAGKYIDNLLQFEPGGLRTSSAEALKSRITESLSSRRKAYCEFNPHLERHEIYSANVPEYMRVAFSRIRLGSHRLKGLTQLSIRFELR